MVIGYSFSDKHINDIIGDGVERELKIFIIDPCGVDVLDKRPKRLVVGMRDEYTDKLAPHIIGAITLNFLVDSGATDVAIPADVVSTLIRTGTIESSDFIGTRTYVLADGLTQRFDCH
jgi:hypothetical protein